MKLIKSDWRNSLRSDTLTALMAISLSPVTVDNFCPDDAIARWWSAGKTARRPRTRPYGQRARSAESELECSSSSSETEEI